MRFREPENDDPSSAWIGAKLENRNGRTVVKTVKRGTPAHDAGVQPEDELIALDDIRATDDDLKKRLEQYRPGDEADLLVARRERLNRLPITLGEAPQQTWKLKADPDASEEAVEHRRAWFEGQ